MLPAHFAPVHPGLMKDAAPATRQGREVPAAAGARLGLGKQWGRGGGSSWAPAINALCYRVCFIRNCHGSSTRLRSSVTGLSNTVRLRPSQRHRAPKSWGLDNENPVPQFTEKPSTGSGRPLDASPRGCVLGRAGGAQRRLPARVPAASPAAGPAVREPDRRLSRQQPPCRAPRSPRRARESPGSASSRVLSRFGLRCVRC